MRVMFVGSLPKEDLDRLRPNICRLCELLASNGVQFALRWPLREEDGREPIDYVVYSCLEAAVLAKRIAIRDDDLLVIKALSSESPRQVSLPHTSYAITDADKIQFYRHILSLTDLVIGVGGRAGLVRIAMLSEQSWKPLFLMPGSGGTADMLWAEYLTRNLQLQCFSDEEIQELRKTPHLNSPDPSYATKVWKQLQVVHHAVTDNRPKINTEVITLDGVSIKEFCTTVARFSLGLWFAVLPLLLSLLSLAYYLGTMHVVKTLWQKLGVGQ